VAETAAAARNGGVTGQANACTLPAQKKKKVSMA